MGRVVKPGEPLFLEEDTAAVIALAEEERDTCPACGFLKVWCRDPAHQFSFEAREEQCWATYSVAAKRDQKTKQGMHPATRDSLQLAPRFRKDADPRLDAGLDFDE